MPIVIRLAQGMHHSDIPVVIIIFANFASGIELDNVREYKFFMKEEGSQFERNYRTIRTCRMSIFENLHRRRNVSRPQCKLILL